LSRSRFLSRVPIVAVRAGPTSLWTPPGGDAPRLKQEDWSKLDAHAKLAVYRHQYQLSKDTAGEMARFRIEAQQKDAQITMLRAQVDSLQTQIAHSNENTPRKTPRRNGEAVTAASIPRTPAMGAGTDTEDRARARAEAQQMDTEIATLRARVESLQSQMAPSAAASGPAGRGESSGAPASAYDHIKRWSLSPSLPPPPCNPLLPLPPSLPVYALHFGMTIGAFPASFRPCGRLSVRLLSPLASLHGELTCWDCVCVCVCPCV
jgi:hypothetical protein